MNTRKIRVPLIIAMLLPALYLGAETLVFDDFSTVGALNGSTPDTTVGGATWEAAVGFTNDGSATTSSLLTQPRIAVLDLGSGYFASNPGVYTLSVDVSFTNANASGAWMAVGFLEAYSSLYFNFNNVGADGFAWEFLRTTNLVNGYGGPRTTNSIFTNSAVTAGTHNLKVELDTSDTLWTVTTYIDSGTVGSTFTYSSNPALRYIGLSTSGTGSGSEVANGANFTLDFTAVPEPSTWAALLGMAMLGLAVLRRRR